MLHQKFLSDSVPDFGLSATIRQGKRLIAALAIVTLGWGAIAPIASAVIAQGSVISQTGPIAVKHPVGGRIDRVLVREAQWVEKGALLATLAPAAVVAAAQLSDTRVRELEAQRRRLVAERDGTGVFSGADGANLDAALRAEARVLDTQRRLETEKQKQLGEQIAQTRSEIAGLREQLAAGEAQRITIESELKAARALHARGFGTLTRVNTLERELFRIDGDRGAQRAAIAQGYARIAQYEVQALQLRSERQSDVLEELKATQLQLAQAQAQNFTDRDARRHLDIRAPVAGQVQQMLLRTGGGVLAPGETLMRIVPGRERLIVEVQIAPDKIDRIAVGHSAKIRFPAFAASTTPEFSARVTRVSASVHEDEKTGASYYLVACELARSANPALKRLRSGMPAEAHISTGSRSALSYFLKPLLDQISRAFRDP